MHTQFRLARVAAISQTSFPQARGDVSRRSGGMRAIMVNNNDANTDKVFGMTNAVQESIEQVFGKTSIDAQLEADTNAYEMKAIF